MDKRWKKKLAGKKLAGKRGKWSRFILQTHNIFTPQDITARPLNCPAVDAPHSL